VFISVEDHASASSLKIYRASLTVSTTSKERRQPVRRYQFGTGDHRQVIAQRQGSLDVVSEPERKRLRHFEEVA
jgi:hypothetical protein